MIERGLIFGAHLAHLRADEEFGGLGLVRPERIDRGKRGRHIVL